MTFVVFMKLSIIFAFGAVVGGVVVAIVYGGMLEDLRIENEQLFVDAQSMFFRLNELTHCQDAKKKEVKNDT